MKRVIVKVQSSKLDLSTEVTAKDYKKDTVKINTEVPNLLRIKALEAILSTKKVNVKFTDLSNSFSELYPLNLRLHSSVVFIDRIKNIHEIDENLVDNSYSEIRLAVKYNWFVFIRNNYLYLVHLSGYAGEDSRFLEDKIVTITKIIGIEGKNLFDQLKKAKLVLKQVNFKFIGVLLAASSYVLWKSSDNYDKYVSFLEELNLPDSVIQIPDTLYRGLSLSKLAISRLKEGKRIKLRPRALTSWDKVKSKPKYVSQQFSKRLSNVENYKYFESGEKNLKPLARGTVLLRLDSSNKNKDDKTECLVNLYEVSRQSGIRPLIYNHNSLKKIIMYNNGGFKYITREDLV